MSRQIAVAASQLIHEQGSLGVWGSCSTQGQRDPAELPSRSATRTPRSLTRLITEPSSWDATVPPADYRAQFLGCSCTEAFCSGTDGSGGAASGPSVSGGGYCPHSTVPPYCVSRELVSLSPEIDGPNRARHTLRTLLVVPVGVLPRGMELQIGGPPSLCGT